MATCTAVNYLGPKPVCGLPLDRPAFPGYVRCAHGHVTAKEA